MNDFANTTGMDTGVTKAQAGAVVVTLHRSLSDVEADWRLLEKSPLVSVHQSFDWCSVWARTHSSDLVVVRAAIDGRTVLLLPLELHRTRFFRTLRFLGAAYSNINTGIFRDDVSTLAPAGFAEEIARAIVPLLKSLADMVVLENIPLLWRGHPHPLSALPSVVNQNRSFQLTLFPDFDATLAQLNAKRRRKKFRTSERRLEPVGGYEHMVARTLDERHSLLDLFFAQKAARFAALGLPDVFADGETRAFFHALLQLDLPEPDVALDLHAIRLKGDHAGHILAIAGMSRKGDHVICQFGSIDDTIASDSSPGELLFYLIVRQYCAEGAALFDFGLGDQAYKRSWCNVETEQSDIPIALTLRGRVAASGHRATVALKSAIKTMPRTYSFLQRIRRGRSLAPAQDSTEKAED